MSRRVSSPSTCTALSLTRSPRPGSRSATACCNAAARSVSATAVFTRVELVVPGHLLRQDAAAVVLEHDEVADQREQRRRLKTPSSSTWSCGRLGSASVSPAIVRHGLNHSRPAVSAPMRASSPSDTTSAALNVNSDGTSALYVWSCWNADQMVAFSSAGFFSSNDGERQAVDEQHEVGPPFVFVLDDGELVDREPVVVVGVVEVEHANLRAADPAFGVEVLHRHAGNEHRGGSLGSGPPASPRPVGLVGAERLLRPQRRAGPD